MSRNESDEENHEAGRAEGTALILAYFYTAAKKKYVTKQRGLQTIYGENKMNDMFNTYIINSAHTL